MEDIEILVQLNKTDSLQQAKIFDGVPKCVSISKNGGEGSSIK